MEFCFYFLNAIVGSKRNKINNIILLFWLIFFAKKKKTFFVYILYMGYYLIDIYIYNILYQKNLVNSIYV